MPLPNPSRWFGLILLLLISTLAFALPEDREKPIHLEADRAQLDQKTGVSIYEGNVVITQGSMRLAADTATVYVKDGTFQRMEATGKPSTFRYKPAADQEEIHGVGQRVEYDATTALVVVSNNAKFTQGKDVFTGDQIEYDLNEDLVRARSTTAGGRVQFTIQPQPDDGPQN